MCGRVIQSSPPELLGLNLVHGDPYDPRLREAVPRYNGAPSQPLWVIRRHPKTGEAHLDQLIWGLIPSWIREPRGGPRPINATAERVASAPMFREAYARRRCLVPVDGFFEWMKIKGKGPRQPYAVAMKSGAPFALAGIWEYWRPPEGGEWVRTFAVITTAANELLGEIHDRMPVIIPPEAYERWLSPIEQDPADLLVPHPAEPMCMWPITTRVNSPENDDPAILTPSL